MASILNDKRDVGTTADMARRLRQTLPVGWFPTFSPLPAASVTPVLDGVLTAIGSAWAFCFSFLSTTILQTRVATATGSFLDMISVDFFGAALSRKLNEADLTFRSRIEASLIRNRGTRTDVINAVKAVTLVTPFVCEPMRAADCGCYGGQERNEFLGSAGYGVFGSRYGSSNHAFQFLLNIARFSDFAPGIICTRQSFATFLDSLGKICLAAPFVLRPNYRNGNLLGYLLEERAFNLITDSRFWTGFARSTVGDSQHSTWCLDNSRCGILRADPVMAVTTAPGIRLEGPSIDVAAAGATIVASAWVLITADSHVTQVELVVIDLSIASNPIYAEADILLINKWQRISVSLSLQPAIGRNLRIGLVLSSFSVSTVLTQCWQVELGNTVTSYIPTSGMFGIREKDSVTISSSNISPPSFTSSDIQDTVAAAIPMATIAWTSVADAYSM